MLDSHGLFWGQQQAIAVDGGRKVNPMLFDFSKLPETPDLEPTRVRQDGVWPTVESMQTAECLNDLGARAQPEMKGVAQDDAGANFFKFAGAHRLHRSISAHWHEDRGFDCAVVQGEAAATGLAVGFKQFVVKHQAGSNRAVSDAAVSNKSRSRSIASP